MPTNPKPPTGLSKAAQAFWLDVSLEFDVTDAAAQRLLLTACESFDRMREAQRLVTKHGILIKDRFGQLVRNPATVVERDARSAMLASLRALNLDIAPPGKPGRPGNTR
jgi:P27 family predicted phage terminase small subunit